MTPRTLAASTALALGLFCVASAIYLGTAHVPNTGPHIVGAVVIGVAALAFGAALWPAWRWW